MLFYCASMKHIQQLTQECPIFSMFRCGSTSNLEAEVKFIGKSRSQLVSHLSWDQLMMSAAAVTMYLFTQFAVLSASVCKELI